MKRHWWAALAALVVVAFVVSVLLERRPEVTVEQSVARAHTAAVTEKAAQVETVYVAAKGAVAAGRSQLRTIRDTLLERLTDTLLVERFVAKVDTQLVRDSLAIAAGDDALAAQKGVTAAVREELRLALVPKLRPRLTTTVGAYYNPLGGDLRGSLQVGVRVIGEARLVARAEQRPVLERPQIVLGISLSY